MKKYQGGGLMPRLSYNAPVPMYLGAPVDELKGTLDVLQNRYDSAQFAMAKTGDALANIASIPGSKDNAYVQQKIQEYEKMREEFSKKALEDPSVMHDALRMSQSFFSDPKFKTIQNSYEGYLNFNKIKQQLIAQGNYQDGLDPDITGWDSETMGVFNMAPTQWVDPKTFINENINNIEFDEDEYGNQYINKTKIFNRAVETYEQFLEHPSGKNWIKIQENNLGRKMSDQEKEEAAFSYLNKEYGEIIFRKGNMVKTGKGSSPGSASGKKSDEVVPLDEQMVSMTGSFIKNPEGDYTEQEVIDKTLSDPENYEKAASALSEKYVQGEGGHWYNKENMDFPVDEEYSVQASNIEYQRQYAIARKQNYLAKQMELGKQYNIAINPETGMPLDPSLFEGYEKAKAVQERKVATENQVGTHEKSGNPYNPVGKFIPDPTQLTPEQRAEADQRTLDYLVQIGADKNLVQFIKSRNSWINDKLNPIASSSQEVLVVTPDNETGLLAADYRNGARLNGLLNAMKTSVNAFDPGSGEVNDVVSALKNNGETYNGKSVKVSSESSFKIMSIGINPMISKSTGYYVRMQVFNPDKDGNQIPGGEIIMYDQEGQQGVSNAVHDYLGADRVILATAGPIDQAMQTGVNRVERSFGDLFGGMKETAELNEMNMTFVKLSEGNYGIKSTLPDGSAYVESGFPSILKALEFTHDELFAPSYRKAKAEESEMSTEDFNAEQQFRKLMGYDTPSGETQEEDEQSYDNPNYQSNSDPEWYKKYSKVDNEKKQTLEFAARELEIDPAHLAQLIDFESGRTWDPAVKNKAGSGATGLIQFMPETAKRLGITTDELEEMDFNEQMEYVINYVKMVERDTGIDIKSAGDIAMSIFFPAAVGKPNDWSIVDWYRRNKPGSVEKFITQNPGIETRGDYLKKAGIQS